jgi:uncharacterized protein (TIGR03492 family)
LRPLLLLSNGHGEDLSGALLARELQKRGLEVEAMPLVGHGAAYRHAGIALVNRSTREFSTGGLGYTSLRGRFTELGQGQALYLLGHLLWLWRWRHRYRLVVAVGDLVPVLAARLMGAPAAAYLVAYSSHYEGRLRLPFPCGWLLQSPCWRAIWSRDLLTAADLSDQLQRPVRFLGNPFLDPVAGDDGSDDRTGWGQRQSLALLPGSRQPEAGRNLSLMLRLLPLLPEPLQRPDRLRLQAALVSALSDGAIEALAKPLGWRLEAGGPDDDGAAWVLRHDRLRLQLQRGRFVAVLGGSDLVLSMAGTAAEQAVGLARPVLQLAGLGPQFTAGFADAQRRLLGAGVLCAPGAPGHPDTLAASAALAVDLLARLADPDRGVYWRAHLSQLAAERIGAPGGSGRLTEAIMGLLEQAPR